jgi:hypothetical protein
MPGDYRAPGRHPARWWCSDAFRGAEPSIRSGWRRKVALRGTSGAAYTAGRELEMPPTIRSLAIASYWTTVDDQMVQHSGTKPPAALKASADEPKRLRGKLAFDDSRAGGPKVEVELDAALVQEFEAVR